MITPITPLLHMIWCNRHSTWCYWGAWITEMDLQGQCIFWYEMSEQFRTRVRRRSYGLQIATMQAELATVCHKITAKAACEILSSEVCLHGKWWRRPRIETVTKSWHMLGRPNGSPSMTMKIRILCCRIMITDVIYVCVCCRTFTHCRILRDVITRLYTMDLDRVVALVFAIGLTLLP